MKFVINNQIYEFNYKDSGGVLRCGVTGFNGNAIVQQSPYSVNITVPSNGHYGTCYLPNISNSYQPGTSVTLYMVGISVSGITVSNNDGNITDDGQYDGQKYITKIHFQANGSNNGQVSGVLTDISQWPSCSAAPYYQHTITFNAKGGSISQSSVKVTPGLGDYNVVDWLKPTRTGYTFDGWYTASGKTKVYDANGKCTANGDYWSDTADNGGLWQGTSDLELYAHWTNTVKFDANGGTNTEGDFGKQNSVYGKEISTLILTYGDSAYHNLTSSIPTRTGYTFEGWYTASGETQVYTSTGHCTTNGSYWSASGNDSNATPVWQGTTDTTFYAHWTSNQYTVNFNANGGSVSSSSKTVTYDSTYGDLPTPSKTGYTFSGWYTAASGGTEITSSTKVSITSNQTLYAHWQEDYITITFDANGGECSETPRQILRGHSIGTLPVPTRTGYTFEGWYISVNKISNGAKVSEDCTVIAWWTQNIYTLTYHANDGSNTTTSRTFTYGETFNLSTEGIMRDGFYITGWTYSQDAISNSLQPNHGIDGSWNSNIDLYAQWAPNTLTINYYSNFATSIESKYEGTADSVDPYGQTLIYTWVTNYAQNVTGDTLHNYSPADGNTFGLTRIGYNPTRYWGNESSGGKTLHEDSSFDYVVALADYFDRLDDFKAESITINLYAQWVPKKYKITYHRNYSADDETCIEQTVTYMSNSFSEWGLPIEWARDGYRFKGYVDKLEGDDQETVYFENGLYNPDCSYWSDAGLWLGTSDIDVYVVWELLELGVSNLHAYWSDDGKILNVKMDKQYDNTVSIKIGTSGSLAQPNALNDYISITDDAFSYEPTDLSKYMFQHIVVYNTKDGEINESVHCCISNKIQTK